MPTSETQWSKANRAAAAVQAYYEQTHPGEGTFGDEGSDEFDEAVQGLLVDLKHLLWRVGGTYYVLTEMAERAAEQWGVEADELPEGGDEDDE